MGEYFCIWCGVEIEEEEYWDDSSNAFCSERCKKKFHSDDY